MAGVQSDGRLMVPIHEALKFTDPDALVMEIHLRKKLREQMVGNLYPNIVADEVGQLVARFEEVGGTNLADALWALQRST